MPHLKHNGYHTGCFLYFSALYNDYMLSFICVMAQTKCPVRTCSCIR